MNVMNRKKLVISIRVGASLPSIIKQMDYKYPHIVAVIAANLMSCITKNQRLTYSRRGRALPPNRKGITSGKLLATIDEMMLGGLLENTIGMSNHYLEGRRSSEIVPTDRFIELFVNTVDQEALISRQEALRVDSERLKVRLIEEDRYIDEMPVVELRDEKKEPVKFKMTNRISEMMDNVREMNRINDSFEYVHDGEEMTNLYCRIFNESFDYGGRFYRADVLRIHNGANKRRLDITINGDPVVEVDYGCLHFRLAGIVKGIGHEHIPDDAYSAVTGSIESPTDRYIVKKGVNIMFNSKTRRIAAMAINREIQALSEEIRTTYTLGSGFKVVKMIDKTYPLFAPHLCTGESFGSILQRYDSDLAEKVVKWFIDLGKPILTIHDSFIVKLEDKDLLVYVMKKMFVEMFKVDWGIPMTIEYKQDGRIVSQSILA